MKELVLQRKGASLAPFDPESAELLKGYLENQPVRAKITGIKRPRSYQQLKAYWKTCQIVADHLDEFASKEDVDWEVRVQLRHIGRMTVQGNKVMVECKSISYANMDTAEAQGYFDRAFALMAKWLGIDKEELLKQSGGE